MFDFDPCIHGGDPLDQKLRTYRRTAFQLYSYSRLIFLSYVFTQLFEYCTLINHYALFVMAHQSTYACCLLWHNNQPMRIVYLLHSNLLFIVAH